MSAGTRTWPLQCDGAQDDRYTNRRGRHRGGLGLERGCPLFDGGRGHCASHTRAPAIADAVVDEWFSTADIGRVDEDGYFYLVARENI
jgi:acyl-coenzyme A synthetase/AMP-(fatty) acid ligase